MRYGLIAAMLLYVGAACGQGIKITAPGGGGAPANNVTTTNFTQDVSFPTLKYMQRSPDISFNAITNELGVLDFTNSCAVIVSGLASNTTLVSTPSILPPPDDTNRTYFVDMLQGAAYTLTVQDRANLPSSTFENGGYDVEIKPGEIASFAWNPFDGTWRLTAPLGGPGANRWIGLFDTPNDLTGLGGDFVRVNVGESGLETVGATTVLSITNITVDGTLDMSDEKIENAASIGVGTDNSEGFEVHAKNSTGVATVMIDSGSGSDGVVRIREGAVSKWIAGNDGDDGDKFKISKGTALGTDDLLTITIDGQVQAMNYGAETSPTGLATSGSIELDWQNGSYQYIDGSTNVTFTIAAGSLNLCQVFLSYKIANNSSWSWPTNNVRWASDLPVPTNYMQGVTFISYPAETNWNAYPITGGNP